MRCKYRIYAQFAKLIIITLLVDVAYGQPIYTSKNEYGLDIVATTGQFKNTLKLDSNKQMVLLHSFYTDFKYATRQNFTSQKLYRKPCLVLRKPVAFALVAVNKALKIDGLALLVYDAYRPYSITRKMWQIVPDDRYAANPAKGSGHNRGAAVDVTLIDLKTHKPLEMPTAFDDFTSKAHHNYNENSNTAINNRVRLKAIMEQFGFVALDTEWWHYYWPDASRKFELMDLDFRQMKKLAIQVDNEN